MNQSLARMERQWKSVSRAASKARKKYLNLNTAIGALAGSTGLGLLVKRSIDAADAIAKTADAIGISTDALQKYRYIAERSGVTTAQLDRGLGAFTKRLGEMRQGTGELNSKIKDFNTELRDQLVTANDTSEALDIFFGALQDVGNQSERVALMSAAMSRTAGVAMTNMIDNVDELRERYNDLGINIEEDLLRQSERAKDSIDDLGAVISTSFTRAVVTLAPEIGQAADNMADWVGDNKDLIEQDIPAVMAGIAKATMTVGKILTWTVGLAEKFGIAMGFMLHGPDTALGQVREQIEAVEQQIKQANKALDIESQMAVVDDKTIQKYEQNISQLQARLESMKLTEQDLIEQAAQRLAAEQKAAEEAANAAEDAEQIAGKQHPDVVDENEKVNKSYQDLIKTLELERENIGKSEAELQALTLIRGLDAELSERQEDKILSLVEAIYDDEEAVKKANKAYEDRLRLAKEWDETIGRSMIQGPGLGAMTGADDQWWREQQANAGDHFNFLDEFSKQTAQNMQQNFSDFFFDSMTGQLDTLEDYWRSFGRTVLRILSDIMAKQLAMKAFGESGTGGWVGGAFDWIGSKIFHSGGVVGQSNVPERPMPMSTFDMAPRLHKGLASNEFPAILEQGETVIPKNPSSPNIEVNVINNTGEKAEAKQQRPKWDGEKWILNVVLSAANHNKGGFGQNLKGALSKA